MRIRTLLIVLIRVALLAPAAASADCVSDAVGGSHCLYRSLLPSSGIIARCRTDRDCRVGYYYGNPDDAVWLSPPPGMATLPKPAVTWETAPLAQIQFDCGLHCSLSYFFEARRRRLSGSHRSVLAIDPRRLLVAVPEERTLIVRQVFSGRDVTRIERDWATAPWLGDVITALSFDPDGRLSLTWLRGAERAVVRERLSIPTVAR